MFAYIAIFVLAKVFHYIGNNEFYEKGWIFTLISALGALAINYLTHLGLLGVIGWNVLFYLVIFVIKLNSKEPPRSQSGF